MRSRAQQGLERSVDAIDVAVVGNHDQGAAACGERGGGSHRHGGRPVVVPLLTRQSEPGRRRGIT
ncbi:MAG TPA: hypothetical protein VHS32_27055 [Streptosporangiaceae bacterium]|nr:hypothetical protein [Streptosporangiaceae bacterium]